MQLLVEVPVHTDPTPFTQRMPVAQSESCWQTGCAMQPPLTQAKPLGQAASLVHVQQACAGDGEVITAPTASAANSARSPLPRAVHACIQAA
jgi:hypothetical protein